MKVFTSVLIAALCCVPPEPAFGQPSGGAALGQGATDGDFSLEPVSPNPFERETRISFRLGEALFEQEAEVRVSMRVFNILHQLVAIPRALDERGTQTGPLDGLSFEAPGLYRAYWDGRDQEGRLVTEGPYFIELTVADRSQVRKVLLAGRQGG